MRKRHPTLSEETSAAPPAVRVPAGTTTVLLFDEPGGSIVARPLTLQLEDAAQPALKPTGARAFIAPHLFAVELTLQLVPGQTPWKPGRVEARHPHTPQLIPVRTRTWNLNGQALQPGAEGVLVLEMPVGVLGQPLLLDLLLHELGGERLVPLRGVRFLDASGARP